MHNYTLLFRKVKRNRYKNAAQGREPGCAAKFELVNNNQLSADVPDVVGILFDSSVGGKETTLCNVHDLQAAEF